MKFRACGAQSSAQTRIDFSLVLEVSHAEGDVPRFVLAYQVRDHTL
jgi:hypothetical protein